MIFCFNWTTGISGFLKRRRIIPNGRTLSSDHFVSRAVLVSGIVMFLIAVCSILISSKDLKELFVVIFDTWRRLRQFEADFQIPIIFIIAPFTIALKSHF